MASERLRTGAQRTVASLSLFVVVCVVTVTGVIAFLRPFSMTVISLHAIFGLCLMITAVWHIKNNFPNLQRYLATRQAIACLVLAGGLAAAIVCQLPPVRAFMNLSANIGRPPAELVDKEDQIRFEYVVSDDYSLEMVIQKGSTYPAKPPRMAIWLENQSAFHIHTLYATEDAQSSSVLPYWSFKRGGWQEAKDKFQPRQPEGIDGISEPTKNSSFDPADYMLVDDQIYTVMLEIELVGVKSKSADTAKKRSSLIYSTEIDNSEPARFQVLSRLGVPEPVADKQNPWQIAYNLVGLEDALTMLDSILVTVHRKKQGTE